MAKPVAPQVLAAIPARHHQPVAQEPFPLQHPQDDHASAALAVITLQRSAIRQENSPGIMRRLGVFLVLFQRLEKRVHLGAALGRRTGYRTARAAIPDDIFKLVEHPSEPGRGLTHRLDPGRIGRVRAQKAIPRIGDAAEERRAAQRIIPRLCGDLRAQHIRL